MAALLAKRSYPLLALTCLPDDDGCGRLLLTVADDGRVGRLTIELSGLPEVASARLREPAMAARNIGVDEAAEAVKKANVNLPVGSVSGPSKEYTVRSSGKLLAAAGYRPIIVAWRDGSPVRLGDIAKVTDSVEETRRLNWFSGTPGLVLAIQRQPGTNTVEVVDAIKELLPRFQAQLPASVSLKILYDRSVSIRDSVSDVKFTLLLTVCLVVMPR